jgi:hypothetical protein
MLTNQIFEQHVTVRNARQDHSDLNRLLAAAVVSRSFCKLLLTEPARAVMLGFAGEHFSLSATEYDLVISAQATSLPEFAQHLCKHLPAPTPVSKPVLSEKYQVRM